MKVSIFLPVYNEREALKRTLRGLIPEKKDLEVFVVDRGSQDGSVEAAAQHDWVRVISQPEGLLASALNAAAAEGSGEVLFFLTPGAVPARGWAEALNQFFSQGVDAGMFRLLEEEAQPCAGLLRSRLSQLARRFLGGPTSCCGLAVRRAAFETIHGFEPVPDFESLVLAKKLKTQGLTLKPIPHDVLVAKPVGAEQADAWGDWADELRGAWTFRKTESFSAERCRRKNTALVLVGHDLLDAPPASDYFAYAREKLLGYNLEKVQSFRGAQKKVVLGGRGTTMAVGQPSGVRVDNHYRTDLQKRVENLVQELQAEGLESLLLFRSTARNLEHADLRDLAEGHPGNAVNVIASADGQEWVALWIDAPAIPAFLAGPLGFDLAGLRKRFHEAGKTLEVLDDPALLLNTDLDARTLYYTGCLERLPA